MENKDKICKLLLPVLQETRNLHDLTNLEYKPVEQEVVATFESGYKKTANVAADSGTAMIQDILRQIV